MALSGIALLEHGMVAQSMAIRNGPQDQSIFWKVDPLCGWAGKRTRGKEGGYGHSGADCLRFHFIECKLALSVVLWAVYRLMGDWGMFRDILMEGSGSENDERTR